MNKRNVLKVLFHFAKFLGLFRVSRWVTRNQLRILGYHGISIADEHLFRPQLFIRPSFFEKRMDFLKKQGFPVIGLGEAIEMQQTGRIPDCAVVITIDDGWYGCHFGMMPVLSRFQYPATIYVSTYYVEAQTQVFNVATSYVFWRTDSDSIELSRVATSLAGRYSLREDSERKRANDVLVAYADTLPSAHDRQLLFRSLCAELDIDWREIERERLIAYLSLDELREWSRLGFDIQLHTHRHRFPAQPLALAEREIADNRAVLRKVANRPLEHLCYPSNEFKPVQFPLLRNLGIATATTTDDGLNGPINNSLQLYRIMDSERASDIEFQARISGFIFLVKKARHLLMPQPSPDAS